MADRIPSALTDAELDELDDQRVRFNEYPDGAHQAALVDQAREANALRAKVADLIAASNGDAIDKNALRASRDKLEEATRDAMCAVERLRATNARLAEKAALADEVARCWSVTLGPNGEVPLIRKQDWLARYNAIKESGGG